MRWRTEASCAQHASGGRSGLAYRAPARLSWAQRYRSRFSDFRLPQEEQARTALAEEIGTDGRGLLEAIYASTTHCWLREIPAIDALRSIWIQPYQASD